ncbi:MAG: peptide chain release factor N(5)-glutamine methyltransferase [Anaerolineales bacterium]|jgi:release factor glutamine methyltransferase
MNLIGYQPAGWRKKTNKEGGRTVGTTLDEIIIRLDKHSDSPGLDAQEVLARVMERPRSWVIAHPEVQLNAKPAAALESLVNRLEGGEPLPYVLGRREFFGLEFEVTPDVLIPRPETEFLVERAIDWLQVHPDFRHAADVGTGSGCIGIALAANIPDLQVMGSDISQAALKMAQRNAVKNGVGQRMDFIYCNLFPPETEYNLIVVNLPYIPTKTLQKLPIYGREPTMALDGGPDGLQLIRGLLNAAPDRLVPGGLLLMEIEASEGAAALSLAYDSFAEAEIHLHKDLAGHDRILEVQI